MDALLLIIISVVVVIAAFAIAYVFEATARKRNNTKEKILTTRKIVAIGIMSAISSVLMAFGEFPLPFIPPFYKMDFSELPVLLTGFAYGPVAGVFAEFLKVLLKLIFKGTGTAYVGELANFTVGVCLVLPASIFYYFKKTKKRALISCALGVVCMTVVGALFNAYYLIPTFAVMFGGMETIMGMAQSVNKNIDSLSKIIFWGTIPLNIIKGVAVSLVTMLIYKPLSRFLKTPGEGK